MGVTVKLGRTSVVLSVAVAAAVVKVLMTEPVRIYHVLRLNQLVVNPSYVLVVAWKGRVCQFEHICAASMCHGISHNERWSEERNWSEFRSSLRCNDNSNS